MTSEDDYFDDLDGDLADGFNEEKEDQTLAQEIVTADDQTKHSNPFIILQNIIESFKTLPQLNMDELPPSEISQISPKIAAIRNILQQEGINFIKLLPCLNAIIPLIKSDIKSLHNFLILLYGKRFPELSSLIPSSLQYSKVASILESEHWSKNESDKLSPQLENEANLTKEQVLVLTMSMKTSFNNKEPLDIGTRKQISEATAMLKNLWVLQEDVGRYVASKISVIAPNMCLLVGPEVAAQLLAYAGGVLEFSRIPSCNIASIGKNKHLSHELHTLASGVRQEGYIFSTDLIQNFPLAIHKQMLRMICAKVTLAARVDASQQSGDRNTVLAQKWKAELLNKAKKLSEAPDIAETKALPIPEDQSKKKRAGRKYRKYKEKFRLSHVRQLQNRMEFGKEEQTVLDSYGEEVGLGMSSTSLQQAMGNAPNPRRSSGNQAKLTKIMKHRLSEANQQTDEYLISLGHDAEHSDELKWSGQEPKKQRVNSEGEKDWFSHHL
ncbi:hypothetical protein SKDZ_07G3370 [Saccharomyces kudriavzevii ZP591]|nr:hypothetical protein SKDZ_07G3370 [Saccharomyces kudriavzevii ZP591]